MPHNRSAGRNVFIYKADDRATELGGLILTSGVTNRNFYSMIEILFIFESTPILRDERDVVVEKNDDPLQPGNYYVTGSSSISDEPWLLRTISHSTSIRSPAFCNDVRQRDGRCVISGKVAVNAHLDSWTGFQAARIFPLAYEGHWLEQGFSRWITIPAATGGTINSVQNGMLLDATIHSLFDTYELSINPDDNYKIICFSNDSNNIAGKHLDADFLSNPRRPSDQLLRWHFRQAIFANIRGTGEPIFEHDFPPGSDMVGDVLCGPKAGERMEYELFSRLIPTNREIS